MMKFFVVFLAIVAAVQADGWTRKTKDEIRAMHIQCIAENPVSEENIVKMKNLEMPDEESVRKYLLCGAIKMDVFCTDEGYNTDRLTEQFKGDFPAAEVKAIFDDCVDSNKQGSPADVWAYRGHKCFMDSKIGQAARENMRNSVYGKQV